MPSTFMRAAIKLPRPRPHSQSSAAKVRGALELLIVNIDRLGALEEILQNRKERYSARHPHDVTLQNDIAIDR